MVFEPQSPLPFALLFLNCENADASTAPLALTRELHKRRLRCVCPGGSRSWWVNRVSAEFDPRLTPEDYLLNGVLPGIVARWNCSSRSLAIAGREMGGQAALRLGFKYPACFSVAASMDGALDFHERHGHGSPLDAMYASREDCRQDTAILHIQPQSWPKLWFACSPGSKWYRGNDRLHEKLVALSIPHTAELNATAPDDDWFPPMLDFITSALERESHRLM